MKPFTHKFVDHVPEVMEEGVVYVSIPFALVSHKCPCGCGEEVVTPISPTDWELIFDGESVSLYPSIGNWSYKCRSHYWIWKNRIEWAPAWTDEQIREGHHRDHLVKDRYYAQKEDRLPAPVDISEKPVAKKPKRSGLLARLKRSKRTE